MSDEGVVDTVTAGKTDLKAGTICFHAAAVCGIVAAALIVIYLYVLHASGRWPEVLVGLRNGLGTLAFSAASASVWFLALGIWRGTLQKRTLEQELTLFGALGFVVVLLVMSMQFLVIGEWEILPAWMYVLIKLGAYSMLLVYLGLAWFRLRHG